MRLPKRGERGFTLIELLIVVAILGVLAAVVIPNVTRFFGKGEDEARRTELHNVSLAVASMMVDNGISSIPTPAYLPDTATTTGAATNDMTKFPDTLSNNTDQPPGPAEPGKVTDPEGFDYDFTVAGDTPGYVLFGHDIYGGDATPPGPNPRHTAGDPDVNYLNMKETVYLYTCEADGTVRQWRDAGASDEYID